MLKYLDLVIRGRESWRERSLWQPVLGRPILEYDLLEWGFPEAVGEHLCGANVAIGEMG